MGDSHHFTLFGTASWIATGAGARSTGGSSVLALPADADEAWTFGWWWANSKTCFPSVLAGCMEARLVALESELTEVRGEVLLLRSEVNRLRQRLVQEEGLRSSGDFGSASSVLDSPLRAPVTESGYSLVSEAELDTRGQGSVVGQSVSPVLSASAPISPAPAVLNWTQRELICRGIGTWIRDCLEGRHRGASGRDRIPLSSRCWLVAKDYHGTDLGALRLFRRFALCRGLVKRGSDCGQAVFVGVPSDREAVWVAEGADLPLIESPVQ